MVMGGGQNRCAVDSGSREWQNDARRKSSVFVKIIPGFHLETSVPSPHCIHLSILAEDDKMTGTKTSLGEYIFTPQMTL